MSECIICGQEDAMMRRCNECNLHVCTEHRLPEKHNCPALLESDNGQASEEQWFDEKFQQVDTEQISGDSDNSLGTRELGLILVIVAIVGLIIYFGVV